MGMVIEKLAYKRRRGVVAVQVAVGLTVIMGFAALGVDVGLMYAAKADLQKVADAAALAAASQLGNFSEAEAQETTVLVLARQAAFDIMVNNGVLGEDIELEESDIIYGFSVWNEQEQRFEFQEGGSQLAGLNAVRIVARRTSSSSNGAVDLVFGGVLGLAEANVEASATAILVPRDIVVVADLSGSYNDDSQFQNYASNDPEGINLYEVWQTLPKTSANGVTLQAWLDANPGMTVKDAPANLLGPDFGLFSLLGSTNAGAVPVFGQTQINSSYSPYEDDGLVRLPYRGGFNAVTLGNPKYTLMRNNLLGLGYSNYEVQCIMANTWSSRTNNSIKSYDASSASYTSEYTTKRTYDLRVAVALGLVYWNSGISGGLWDTMGWAPGSGGWGITSSEIVPNISYPFPSGNWLEYVAYMRDTDNSNWGIDALPGIKYHFGAKTFTNFLLEEKEQNNETDVTHHAYANPLHLTKNSLDVLMDDIASLDSADRVALVTYGTTPVMDYELPEQDVELEQNAEDIKYIYRHRQAAHYSPATNIGAAIEMAATELDHSVPSSNARPEASKVMVLLTDGMANIDIYGDFDASGEAGIQFAKEAAQAAWDDQRIKIYAIGVGSGADMATLNDIALAGQTDEAYHANGSFEDIEEELTGIFQKIGGMRPVQIID